MLDSLAPCWKKGRTENTMQRGGKSFNESNLPEANLEKNAIILLPEGECAKMDRHRNRSRRSS
jgi:hypothetical protein